MSKRGTIMYLSINDFFKNYLSKINGDLGEKFQILIVSKDIITDTHYKDNNGTVYTSNYENIDFTLELFPNPNVVEYRYGASVEAYAERYRNQLDSIDCGRTLASIADLVVNEGYDVYLICSHVEFKMEYFDILKEYFFEKFGLVMHSYEEFVDNPECIDDIGDIDNAKVMLQFQINNMKLVDETIGQFFNQFTSDLVEKYREILMSKTVDELFILATSNGLHISKYKPKELIVEHLINKLVENSELPFK